jgi:hypothetical protein
MKRRFHMPLATIASAVLSAARVMTILAAACLVLLFFLLPAARVLAHDDHHHAAPSSAKAPSVDVEIVVQEGGHPLLKGPQTHGQVLTLVAGEPIVLLLRNEDSRPREFISPLFTKTETHFVGRATGIFRKDAAGFRVNPGDTLTLQFTAPYSGFRRMYDLIWCGHHEGQPGTEMNDLLIVMTEEK